MTKNMIVLTDTTEIKKLPREVFNWFLNLKTSEDYRNWHPDHVQWVWLKGKQFSKGSIVYSEEYLHGELHKLKLLCTKIVPNKLIEYKPLFPWSLFMLTSSFSMEPTGHDSCLFTAIIRFRNAPFIKSILKKQLKATRLHMKEEGEKLRLLLEAKTVTTSH
jgi:hypothetical protein